MNSQTPAPTRRDRGQILVIVAVGMVVLLGIGALVVDLGMSWMLRREEQNAADPGAIAAARYIPVDNPLSISAGIQTQMDTAACLYAKENGFFAGDDSTCSAARTASPPQLEVNYPPSAQAGTYAGHPGRVEVIIRTEHDGFFSAIFGRSSATVAAGAVAANEQGQANSASLVALDPTTCKAGSVSGNNTSVVIEPLVAGTIGGYVHINSECSSGPPDNACSGTGDGALRLDGTGSNLTAPYVYVKGTCKTGSSTLNAPLEEGANRIGDPLSHLAPPPIDIFTPGRCGVGASATTPTGAGSKGCGGSGISWEGAECEPGITCVQLDPGVYYGGWTIGNNLKIQLSPGVYYIAGGGVRIQAPSGSIESVAGTSGAPPAVMIFSTDNPNYTCPGGANHECQGGIDLLANSTFKLTGLTEAACSPLGYPKCPYQGLLLWQDGNGSKPDSVVKLGGGTNLEISGTIYAPKAEVQINGGSDGNGVATVQIISWRWDISGGSQLYMPYDPAGLWHPQSRGLVR